MAVGQGESEGCSVPQQAEESLLQPPAGSIQPPSMVASLRSSDEAQAGCARYYRLGRAAFPSSDARIETYSNPPGPGQLAPVPLEREEILSRICQPIWLLISRRDFKRHEGG